MVKFDYWEGKEKIEMNDGNTLNVKINKLHSPYDFNYEYLKTYGYPTGIDSSEWKEFHEKMCKKRESLK